MVGAESEIYSQHLFCNVLTGSLTHADVCAMYSRHLVAQVPRAATQAAAREQRTALRCFWKRSPAQPIYGHPPVCPVSLGCEGMAPAAHAVVAASLIG